MDVESSDLQKGLDVEVVSREDDFKEHLLVDSDEFLVPLADICRSLARVILLLRCRAGVILVVRAPFEHLLMRRSQYRAAAGGGRRTSQQGHCTHLL